MRSAICNAMRGESFMAIETEKIYECQAKRRRLKAGGGYEPFWKLKPSWKLWPTTMPNCAAPTAPAL